MDGSARIQGLVGTTFKYVSLVVIGLMVMLPVVIILLASFKTTAEFNRGAPFAPPGNWFNVDNFATALNRQFSSNSPAVTRSPTSDPSFTLTMA